MWNEGKDRPGFRWTREQEERKNRRKKEAKRRREEKKQKNEKKDEKRISVFNRLGDNPAMPLGVLNGFKQFNFSNCNISFQN